MKKIIFFAAFGLTATLFAGMEGTEQCNRNIAAYASQISQLQGELSTLNAQIEDLKAKISVAESKLKEFSEVFLIPRWLKEKKCKTFQEQKSDCDKQLAEKTQVQQSLNSRLSQAEKEMKNEDARLHRYQKITLTRIEINSYGNWDQFLGPEIRVYMDGRVILKGADDTFSVSENIFEELPANVSYLHVKDEDGLTWEEMGKIPLDLPEQRGVSGDTDSRTVKGTVEKRSGLGFRYEVTYNIEY